MGVIGKLIGGGDGNIVGLNIGTDSIKAVEVRGGKGRLEVVNVAVAPTPEGTVDNGVVIQPDLLGQTIKSLLSENGFKAKRVVSSVAGQQSLVVRIIEVPRMSSKDLAETMKFEVERHIPFSASEVIMDFQALPEQSQSVDSPNMEVLLAVAQEDMINAHVETLEHAGLIPKAIDIEPLAAGRAAVAIRGAEGAQPGESIAIINIGASVTDISIVKDGVLNFTRSVPLAGASLTTAIADALGLQKEEAERAKREMGAALQEYELGESGHAGFDPSMMAAEAQPAAEAGEGVEFTTDGLELGAEETQTPVPSGLDTGQKEELDFGIPFSLDSLEPAAAPSAGPAVTPEAQPQAEGFDLSLTDETPVAPSVAPLAAPPVAAQLQQPAEGFDLTLTDETPIPEAAAPAAPVSPEPGPLPLDLSFGVEEPTPSATPSASAPTAAEEPAAVPFDLSLDLADSTPTPAPASELAPAAPAAPAAPVFDFALEGETPEPAPVGVSVPQTSALDLDKAPSLADSMSGFDLDLGETPPPSPAAPAQAGDLGAGFALDLEPVGAGESPSDVGAFSLDFDQPAEPTPSAPTPAPTQVLAAAPDDGFDASAFGAPTTPAPDTGLVAMGAVTGEVSEATVYQAMLPSLSELVTEIQRSLEYYTSRYEDAAISRIVLLGGTARLKHLDAFLSRELGVKTETANPFDYVDLGGGVSREYVAEMGPTLAISVGLALRDMVA